MKVEGNSCRSIASRPARPALSSRDTCDADVVIGTRTRYHSGDDPLSLLRVANTFDRVSSRHWPKWSEHALQGDDGYSFTSPVGSFAPNAWGLHDMHGNAWEWVSDWYGADYYAHSPPEDPRGPATGDVRVRRGGSWHTWPFYLRASFRNWNTPQTRYPLVGMRLVLESPGAASISKDQEPQ